MKTWEKIDEERKEELKKALEEKDYNLALFEESDGKRRRDAEKLRKDMRKEQKLIEREARKSGQPTPTIKTLADEKLVKTDKTSSQATEETAVEGEESSPFRGKVVQFSDQPHNGMKDPFSNPETAST
jgi:hypothetical protein